MLNKFINVDTKLYHEEMTLETVKALSALAPFGQGNQEPLFLIDEMIISHAEKVGKTGA